MTEVAERRVSSRGQRLRRRFAADTIPNGMSVDQIKRAIDQLSFEERAEVAAWLHGWEDDNWDAQLKRDIAEGKLDAVLREVDEDIQAGRLTDMP
ncbi:MAG TPA: hypothetical protein VK581_12680 [Chthoniobacterales bacterium]|nr:hypothetical protein [Chthoniobacterales bacterium]